MDLARAPRRAPLTARKKGSGYENACKIDRPRPGLSRLSPRPHTKALGTRLTRPLCKVNQMHQQAEQNGTSNFFQVVKNPSKIRENIMFLTKGGPFTKDVRAEGGRGVWKIRTNSDNRT